MKNYFDIAFEEVIGLEGGYNHNIHDPGGETKYGIAKKYHPNEDIKSLSLVRAKEIYKDEYWDKVEGDKLIYPLNLYVFSCAVNMGIYKAITLLQKALNVTQDGIIGKNTLESSKNITDEELEMYFVYQALEYGKLANFSSFGKGWLKRICHLMLEYGYTTS